MTSPNSGPQQPTLGSTGRSIASLLLVIHLFGLGVAYFSVFEPAPLQQRLLGVMAPYLQLFNHDLDYAPYYLTRDRLDPEFIAQFREREYRVEALPAGADPADESKWFQVGSQWSGASENYRRLQRLSYIPVVGEREEWQAEVAGNLARLAESQLGAPVGRIRIRQHIPVPRDYYEAGVEVDPNSAEWFRRDYEAMVVNGSILPVVENREAAGGNPGASGTATPSNAAPASPASPTPPVSATPANPGSGRLIDFGPASPSTASPSTAAPSTASPSSTAPSTGDDQ